MSIQRDVEIHVDYEDQASINKFALNNSKLNELKDELELKRKELTNIQDSLEALEELSILCDIKDAPFLVGETFLIESTEDIQQSLNTRKEKIELEIENIQKRYQTIKSLLSDLKVKLYGKFGKSINLENDDE
ncbi:unnamed protein product [Didymodactylos carnosus]|uniref:Prefoldin subunit 4 n=1 Tax=Didymodactylos carnosus TaxID=1234261 RepID=A0A814UMB4_9BILA|nr:unnamed protein product [Didymodactylos carnosus]CAF1179139.1 unnamed protein product [Didymodactylos carnosus]CAF3687594.1 unnamed protein product [Didymodactylos carnosus]CAF3943360.1 unnamed protein product [Didymodactylos carnosus]